MPRLGGAFVAVLLASGAAAAQPGSPGDQAFPPLPRIGLPLPTIGLPLPTLGLPLAPLGLPPRIDADARRRPGTPHPERRSRFRHGLRRPSAVYFVSPYPWGWPSPTGSEVGSAAPGVVAAAPEEEPTGAIQLDVEPSVPFQIYVDGYFVGTSDDLGHLVDLDAGAHRIEIRAAGYVPHAFDAKVRSGRKITYRAALGALADPPSAAGSAPVPQDPAPAAALAPGPTTIYFIPGCYLGNLPPDTVKLPAGCDLGRLQTYKP